MKSDFQRLLLVLLTLSISAQAGADAKPHEIQDIAVPEAARLIAQDSELVIIDIRTPGEFAQGHIANAVNIDFSANDFVSRISALDKNKTYLMHCQSGGRSGKSLIGFKELGFLHLHHLKAGFAGWQEAGLPVEN